MQISMTPYEQFLRQSIEDQKAERDKLFNEFAKSNPVKKQLLKRKIEEINQNLALLSADLEKYMDGLGWLREPSKERDEKAEHLPKLAKEEAAAPAPAGAPPKATPTVSGPTIGKPIGAASSTPGAAPTPAARPATGVPAPRPTVGTPVGRPQIGSPVGAAKTDNSPLKPVGQPATPASPVPRHVIGTPVNGVKRPVIGTPIGTPKQEAPAAPKPAEKKDAAEAETSAEKSDAAT